MDLWKPEQYTKYQTERAGPFWDLAKMVDFNKVFSMVDIGCGTGELTKALREKYGVPKTLGIDSSRNMLEKAQPDEEHGLSFEHCSVDDFRPRQRFDLVFSNAALQWVSGHDTLIGKLLSWLNPGGQFAVQVPFNQEHPSHRIAEAIAAEYGLKPRPMSLLTAEDYARFLWNAGMHNIDITTRVYLHPMPSAHDVVEWTKGTLLTYYQQRLSEIRFNEFVRDYTKALLEDTGEGLYLYTFKRLFLYATKD